MTVAIANAPVSGIPGKTIVAWMSRSAVIAVLVTAFAVVALTERGEATTCGGTPLAVTEVILPVLTDTA
jgi:hypothetical protein